MTGRPGRAVIHIGTHKTGTTSIQHFLQAQDARLRANGVRPFRGRHSPTNHAELHTATIRGERPTPFKLDHDLLVDDAYRGAVARDVAGFLDAAEGDLCVFSAEGLSYLRHPDEMERLAAMFAGHAVTIVVYLREPEAYHRSHAAEFERRRQRGAPMDASFADLGPGSWLLDYRARLRPFRQAFGSENVTVMDYDVEVERDGQIIPSFLRILGMLDHFSPADWEPFVRNRS